LEERFEVLKNELFVSQELVETLSFWGPQNSVVVHRETTSQKAKSVAANEAGAVVRYLIDLHVRKPKRFATVAEIANQVSAIRGGKDAGARVQLAIRRIRRQFESGSISHCMDGLGTCIIRSSKHTR
jgi:hypothetical protein